MLNKIKLIRECLTFILCYFKKNDVYLSEPSNLMSYEKFTYLLFFSAIWME